MLLILLSGYVTAINQFYSRKTGMYSYLSFSQFFKISTYNDILFFFCYLDFFFILQRDKKIFHKFIMIFPGNKAVSVQIRNVGI